MREFRMESYYDKEIGEIVDLYFVDGKQVCADDYYEHMDLEVEEAESEDDDCEYCEFNDDETIPDEIAEIAKMVEEYAQEIEGSECNCGCFLRDTLLEVFCKGISIGRQDCKNWILEVINRMD